MKKSAWVFIITIVLGIAAFLAVPILWPTTVAHAEPTANEFNLLVILSVAESLLFGYAIAFGCLYFGLLRNVPPSRRILTIAAFISTFWLLVSWWPHDNLHWHMGFEYSQLIAIEYGFHLTNMIATIIISIYMISNLNLKSISQILASK